MCRFGQEGGAPSGREVSFAAKELNGAEHH